MSNPNRKTSRGPRKPIRAHVPGPTVEYSQKGRRVLTAEEAAALNAPGDKPAKSAKRSTFVDEASDRGGSEK